MVEMLQMRASTLQAADHGPSPHFRNRAATHARRIWFLHRSDQHVQVAGIAPAVLLRARHLLRLIESFATAALLLSTTSGHLTAVVEQSTAACMMESLIGFTPEWNTLGPFQIGTRGKTDLRYTLLRTYW